MPASAPKATRPHAHTCPQARSERDTSEVPEPGGVGFCHQMPPCSLYTPATHVTCWHTFSLLVRSTYRDTSRAYLKSQPPHRQTVRHSGHGVGGAFQPQAELSPQSHLSPEAQG